MPRNNLFVFLANPRSENDPYAQFELPYLEDGAAIQIGFMQLIHGVSQQRLEQWRARMILSALHGAAANLRMMEASSAQCETPRPSQKMARTGHPACEIPAKIPSQAKPASTPTSETRRSLGTPAWVGHPPANVRAGEMKEEETA